MTEQQLENVMLGAAMVEINNHIYAYVSNDKYTIYFKQVDGERQCCIPIKRMLNSNIQYVG